MSEKTDTDDFETIAQDAVAALMAIAFTLKLMGHKALALEIATRTEEFCHRAIALGGEQ